VRSWDHLPYGITQCYLPPDGGDSHAFTPGIPPYSFIDPGRMKGWVDLGGWLHQDGLPVNGHYPSVNRARRRVTTLIETNALPLGQATNWRDICCHSLISYRQASDQGAADWCSQRHDMASHIVWTHVAFGCFLYSVRDCGTLAFEQWLYAIHADQRFTFLLTCNRRSTRTGIYASEFGLRTHVTVHVSPTQQ